MAYLVLLRLMLPHSRLFRRRQNHLDLYVPLPRLRRAADGTVPLVVFFHGGAFQHGGRVWMPSWLWAWRKRGFAIASVDYRFEAYPAPVDDVRAAVRWLAGNAARYGIDTRRISVIGSSSGGCHRSGAPSHGLPP